ncbi:hypothetical protein F4782DRAFT_302422 [Xylaria castorea]|nr:hypothetical protein F4782DRAFT_302422 [Xylaria castorea]
MVPHHIVCLLHSPLLHIFELLSHPDQMTLWSTSQHSTTSMMPPHNPRSWARYTGEKRTEVYNFQPAMMFDRTIEYRISYTYVHVQDWA